MTLFKFTLILAMAIAGGFYFFSFNEIKPIVTSQPPVFPMSNLKDFVGDASIEEQQIPAKVSSVLTPDQVVEQKPIASKKVSKLTLADITFEDRLVLLQDQRLDTFISKEDMQLGLSQTKLWKSGDKADAANQLPYLTNEQINDGREFIHFQKFRLEVTLEGEQFQIALPNSKKPLIAQVAERTVLDGIIHWRGFFPDETGDFQEFSFTQALSDDYVVGSINVSGEAFSIEAKNGFGWVATEGEETHFDDGGVNPENTSQR